MQSLHSKKSHKWIIVLAITLAILLVNPFAVGDRLRTTIGNFFNPITSYGTKIGTVFDNALKSVGRLTTLQVQKQALQDEVASLKTQIALSQKTNGENERLRKSLNLLPKHKYNLLGADVIGYDLRSAGEWVMIDRGSSHGLEVGMSAILGKDILIGLISEVFDNSARVQLITSKESILGGIEPSSASKVIIKGDHGLGMIATEIPRDITIEIGTTLLSLSNESHPDVKDLGIGFVKEVLPAQDNLTQQAILEPLFSPGALSEVYIITSVVSLSDESV